MPSDLAKLHGYGSVVSSLDDILTDWSGDNRWAVGTSVRYGLYLETGTSRMPPYPWLGPAIQDVVNSGRADQIADEAANGDELVKGIALEIEKKARKRTMSSSERPYPDTGNLASSIKAEKIN